MSAPVLRRSDDDGLVWREFEDEVLALDMERSIYLRLNRSGAVLWERLADGATRSDLIAVLTDRFDVGPEEAAADVDAFVAACRERGLVRDA